nr:CDP-alcohol phosphatidyltransferase family protein [Acuticoccus yangtzensis]
MYDARLRLIIDPILNRVAARARRLPVSADAVTVAGLVAGLGAAAAIVCGAFEWALGLIILNRLADGLDGALARQRGATLLGGYIDIVFDFIFYGAIPLAFALVDPQQNGLAAACLLFSFYANGATFLAFSAVAAEAGLATEAQGKKTIYYLAGLAEGAETIAVFCLMALLPWAFAPLAFAFAALCTVSAGARIVAAWQTLSRLPPPSQRSAKIRR